MGDFKAIIDGFKLNKPKIGGTVEEDSEEDDWAQIANRDDDA